MMSAVVCDKRRYVINSYYLEMLGTLKKNKLTLNLYDVSKFTFGTITLRSARIGTFGSKKCQS